MTEGPQVDPRFKQAVELFNNGEWYEAHDVIEELNCLLEPGICLWPLSHQRFAIFLSGNFLNRMDSGVTSSISSGPMYSKARSKVI